MERFVDYVSPKEIVHSSIIADFLNPKGHHLLGDAFIRQFLQKCKIDGKPKDIRVYTEYSLHNGPWDGRRIDILIRSLVNNLSVAIIIENKLNGALYQPNQLEDYRAAIEKECGDDTDIKVVCIHRDWDSEGIPNGADEVIYPEELSIMIDNCIKISNSPEACYIKAYSRYLKNLHINNYIMDNANILASEKISGEEIKKIKALADAINFLPQAYAAKLVKIVKVGGIEGADTANIDGYDHYADIYTDSVYSQTSQWLAVGFVDETVCFYLVSNEPDIEESNRRANLAGFSSEGSQGKCKYNWYKPISLTDFILPYVNGKPDFRQIKERTEKLLHHLNKVPDRLK